MSKTFGIKLLEHRGVGDTAALVGQWVKRYDPDGNDGFGALEATPNPEEALRFPNAGAALELYGKVATNRPLREDHKLNRPLMAWTVSISPLNGD